VAVYLAFLFLVYGIAVLAIKNDVGAALPVGACLVAAGLTYFWFQFRPLS
jgi:hypothetical protein